MRILLTGATGFLGRHLLPSLLQHGHEVVCAVRHVPADLPPGVIQVSADFVHDTRVEDWLPRLAGMDCVVNAVGIIREAGPQTFDLIHHRTPRALFTAAAQAGVGRVIQISALGADEHAQSPYHLSKKQADDYLATLPLSSVIVQPSVVYGADGSSAVLFTTLASLPLLGLPGGGAQQLQPVYVDDLVEAVVRLVQAEPNPVEVGLPIGQSRRITCAGPQPLTLKQFLAQLTAAMGLAPRLVFAVPMPLVRLGAAVAGHISGSLLDAQTLAMLERGNTGDVQAFTRLLGRAPRPVSRFIDPAQRQSVRRSAQLHWLLPLLRFSIASVWMVTGIVSLGIYPLQDSYALLARVGVTGWMAPVMLVSAALMDLAIGIAILAAPSHWRKLLWMVQLAVIVFYTGIITWKLPEFWWHPYGPLLKNLPMLASIILLMELED